MDEERKAVELFKNGLNCSQAILAVFGESHGLDLETAKALGRPLGGGLGRMGLACGAVTGAVVALGLMKANGADEAQCRDRVAESVRSLITRFEEMHGTTVCSELLGARMSTKEGMEKIKKEELVSKLCPVFVQDAARILKELQADATGR